MKTLIKILIIVCLLAAAPFIKAETLLDFDGDGKTDFVVVRANLANLEWHISRSSDGVYNVQTWGLTGTFGPVDYLTPADYDGDGKTDVAVWRRSDEPGQSAFWILNSSDGTVRTEYMGQTGDLLNAWGDYDGDGKADPVLYRRTAAPGRNLFIYRGSLNNPGGAVTTLILGSGYEYKPYRGDFDGDGKFDFCVRRNDNATFVFKRSSDGAIETVNFGSPGDWIAPGDYDGDGRWDFCVSRIGKGNYYYWHIKERDGGGTGFGGIIWGRFESTGFQTHYSGGDFDGDGRADIGVYANLYPNTGEFRIRKSSDFAPLIFPWGNNVNTDNPIIINTGF
jgi:hypothetical protein